MSDSTPAGDRATVVSQILDALIDPVLSIDEAGIIQTANPAVETVFGWSADELIGRNVNMLMGEPYRTEHDGYLETYMRTGEARAIGRIRKVIGRRRNGRDFPCELSVSALFHPAGRRFVGVVRDLTDREELMARLAQAERLAAVGELAAGVAHEINNPVNTIINCAQLLKDGDDDPQTCDDILHEGMRIASIVRDLLDFSRDRREQHSLTRIGDVVRRTVSLIAGRIEKQGIRLEVEIAEGLPAIRGRSQQLQQVFLNLLLNARDAVAAAREDGEIRVTAGQTRRDSRSWVTVTVRDDGHGIAAEHLERIFQPFYTTKRDAGGTGLGLAVSHGIVKDHGGELVARSEPGEYAEFEVMLPLCELDDEGAEDRDAETDDGDGAHRPD